MFERLGIGGKLALAFGALASVTVLVVLLALLANRQVTREIRVAQADRLPASLASAQAQASLLRMQLHVRGYLVLGDPLELEQFDKDRKAFEGSLRELQDMAKTWKQEDAREVERLASDYRIWMAWPQRLFELHDNPLKNRGALRLARIELQPRRVDVLKHVESIAEVMRSRQPTSESRQQLEHLSAFQDSFDAMATNLMAYAASGELNFKLAYGPQLATNAAQWQALNLRRDRMDGVWREHLDAIAARRAEIGDIALQIVNVITGERAYEDLYLYSTEAEPQAQRLLAVLEHLTRRQQTLLQEHLSEARNSLAGAQLPATVGGLLAIALALTLALLCQHYIAGPVRRLTTIAEQVAAGVTPGDPAASKDDLGRLAHMIQTRLKKEELQLLMASVSDAIWSADIAGPGQFRYRYWSPVIESIAGVPPERLACSRQAWLEVVHPAARDRVQQILARITMGGSDKEEAEYRIVRADGATRWVRDSIRATRFGGGRAVLNGMISDITPRKEAESALRESEERFRSLTQLSSDWYWKQDAQFRFVDFSGDVAEMPAWHPTSSIGHRRDELPGVTLLTGSWAEHQAVLEARLPFRDFEYSRPGDDGQTRYIRVSGGPVFDDRGEFLGYEGIGRDVTERRRAEEEVRRLEDQLRHAQRLEAVGTLAGGIAHDFNNILGAILGYGEMALRDAAAGTRLKRDLDSIMIAGERGRVLVDRILMFSRSSVGEKISVPVQDVVQEAIDLVVDRIPRDIRVETRFEAGRAAMLGDPTQVHQVVSNLAMNALQAMPDGGFLRISLTLQREERTRIATVGSLAPGEYIVLTVADTGTGIRKDILERIFDPFFTTKEVGVGTGLGLSLVHGIVTNVRGAVDVQSKSGVGSTFTVYLPRSGSAPVEDTADPASSHLVQGSGEVVLIVDDEEALVQLASDNLLSLGYVPVPYTSSLRALDAFRADPGRFDAALVDERMPGMSGMSLIRELRAVRSHFPVLLVTGLVNDDVIAAARQAGASDVLKKPVLLRELATRLAATIAGGVPASEPAQET